MSVSLCFPIRGFLPWQPLARALRLASLASPRPTPMARRPGTWAVALASVWLLWEASKAPLRSRSWIRAHKLPRARAFWSRHVQPRFVSGSCEGRRLSARRASAEPVSAEPEPMLSNQAGACKGKHSHS